MKHEENSSYSSIIKSTGIIGGSSLINVLVSMVRVKFTAVYLGPLGVGLFGAYTSIMAPVITVAGLGLSASGVRQIAEAAGSGNQEKAAKTIIAYKRATFASGLIGALLLLIIAYPASLSTFGNLDHVGALAILSVSLFFGSLASGYSVVLQGLRRVRDYAIQGILGALIGLPVGIFFMMTWGVKGIVPMMVAGSMLGFIVCWFYARRVSTPHITMTWKESWKEIEPLIKLGLVFMGAGLMSAGVAYLTRLMIIRELGLAANGLYSSAYMLSNYYVGLVLAAMNTDFCPRLTEASKDHKAASRLINEQIKVGVLITLPGIMATLLFAPLVIKLFYTDQFYPAIGVLQWLVLAIALRVVAWPMGTLTGSMGAKRIILVSEVITNTISLALLFVGIKCFGFEGTGIAMLAHGACSIVIAYLIARHLVNFTWSASNKILLLFSFVVLLLTFIAARQLPLAWEIVLGGMMLVSVTWFSYRSISKLLGKSIFAIIIQRLKRS